LTSSLNLAIYASALLEEVEEASRAVVTLEEARASFSLFGKGLSEKYLQAKDLGDAPAILANPRRPFPFSDGKEIYLPSYLDVFTSREENWRVYRLYTSVQAWQWEAGTFDRPRADEAAALGGRRPWMGKKEPLAFLRFYLGSFPMPFLAADIFITLETARASLAMAGRFAGLASDLSWFLARLGPNIEPVDHRAVLWNVFFDLLAPLAGGPAQGGYPREVMDAAAAVSASGTHLKHSLDATLAIYSILEPMLKSSLAPEERILLEGADDFFTDTMPGLRGNKATRFGREEQEEGGELVPPELAEALNLDFYSYLLPAGVGEFLMEDALGKKLGEDASDAYQRAKLTRKETAEPEEEAGLEEQRLLYPEWDYLAGGYRRDWATLYGLKAEEGSAQAAKHLLEEWDDLVREVTRQFRMLRLQERTWRKRLEWGEEIEISEAVERQVALRCGLPPTEKVYMEKRRVTREVSALFLLDLSASTSTEITTGRHEGETVLQVLVASVAIMARALEQLGDRYGIYGFSGYGRKRVEFQRIKSFNEPLGEEVWQRLGGLKPMKSTRMGTAVRHAHHLLNAEPSSLKLMLLLSDGYPQDYDYGEDRTDREYGLRDTAQALREAEAGHIIPFNLTVDAAGHDYLRRMCPPHGYLVLGSVEDLPAELPKVYLRLRGS
jgi:nitric oxide reductase NorD protein